MRAQRSIGGIEESTSKRTVDLTFLAPRPALSRIPIDKALGSVAIHGMRKNGHRVGVPSSISPRPTDYYWVYIHREREGERGRDGRERERGPFRGLHLPDGTTLRYQPYSFRTGFNALCQQYVFPTPLLLSLNLRYPVPVVIGTLYALDFCAAPDIARRSRYSILRPSPPSLIHVRMDFTATPSRYFRAETGPPPCASPR